jgi:LacI family transcriptional regulator
MKSKRIKVALLIDKSETYDRGLIKGIIKYSNLSTPWEFFLVGPNYIVSNQKEKLIKDIIKWKPDYIVMNDDFEVSDLEKLQVPIFVTSTKYIDSGAVNIIADDYKLGKLGATYFIDRGHENFAFYGSNQIFWSCRRKSAFQKTVLSKQLSFFETESLLDDGWQKNVQQLIPWLQKLPKPIAIMACSDEFGAHLLEASQLANLKVPEEVAILGVDNDEFVCNLYGLPMSSIDQNSEAIGLEIAHFITINQMHGKELPKEIIGKNMRIVSRRSTDIFAIRDPQLKKALEFIQLQSKDRRLTVDDVVNETFLSRRLLEIRFRKILNRTILQEIIRVRIDIICKNLIQTDKPINKIAYEMGFNSLTSFSNSFKKEMDISALEFRKQFKITVP